jgi:insertion element IS1 protein InsB
VVSLHPEQVEVEIWRAEEREQQRGLSSELDERGAYVAKQAKQRWLWYAIDHHTGKVLAYVAGRRKAEVFLRLQAMWEPFGITRYYTDGWGAYDRHGDAETPRGEGTHAKDREPAHQLAERIKRLVRRTSCFAKAERMHDIVIGLCVNRYEFGVLV